MMSMSLFLEMNHSMPMILWDHQGKKLAVQFVWITKNRYFNTCKIYYDLSRQYIESLDSLCQNFVNPCNTDKYMIFG